MKLAKKTGRPAFPTEHRTMNVYLPNDLHDRLSAWAHHLRCSKSSLIRIYVEQCLDDAEIDAVVKAKQRAVYKK